jgi:hypothetical protein
MTGKAYLSHLHTTHRLGRVQGRFGREEELLLTANFPRCDGSTEEAMKGISFSRSRSRLAGADVPPRSSAWPSSSERLVYRGSSDRDLTKFRRWYPTRGQKLRILRLVHLTDSSVRTIVFPFCSTPILTSDVQLLVTSSYPARLPYSGVAGRGQLTCRGFRHRALVAITH